MCTKDFLRKCEFWSNMPLLYRFFSVDLKAEILKIEFLFVGRKAVYYRESISISTLIYDNTFISMYVQPYYISQYQSDLRFFKDFIHKCKSGQIDYFLSHYVKSTEIEFISFVRSL